MHALLYIQDTLEWSSLIANKATDLDELCLGVVVLQRISDTLILAENYRTTTNLRSIPTWLGRFMKYNSQEKGIIRVIKPKTKRVSFYFFIWNIGTVNIYIAAPGFCVANYAAWHIIDRTQLHTSFQILFCVVSQNIHRFRNSVTSQKHF